MLPDRVSNLGPLTYESGALRGPAIVEVSNSFSQMNGPSMLLSALSVLGKHLVIGQFSCSFLLLFFFSAFHWSAGQPANLI